MAALEHDIINKRLQKSLSELLSVYPEMCGQLVDLPKGELEVLLNNTGVMWITQVGESDNLINNPWLTSSDRKFALQSTPKNIVVSDKKFITSVVFTSVPTENVVNYQVLPLLFNLLQVIVGISTFHSLVDGSATFNFKKQWSDYTNGLITLDDCKHSFDRSVVNGVPG